MSLLAVAGVAELLLAVWIDLARSTYFLPGVTLSSLWLPILQEHHLGNLCLSARLKRHRYGSRHGKPFAGQSATSWGMRRLASLKEAPVHGD